MFLIFGFILGAAGANAFPNHLKRQGIDPTAQHIDVSGAHAFVAPGLSDLRGPCPAMNAVANHGKRCSEWVHRFPEVYWCYH